MFLHKDNTMAILLKTASVRVSSIQIMQVRVQNKGKSVWKSRYDGDVSTLTLPMFVVGLAPRRKRKQTSGIMLDWLTKSRGGRMEIRFEAGLKRPRDATE